MNHNDKVVVITGAANGIGAQLTRKLAAEGRSWRSPTSTRRT